MCSSCRQAGGVPLPILCGNIVGNHMYLNADSGSSSELSLSHEFRGAANSRKFRYKVSQIPCGTSTTPPEGCVQFQWGVSGTVESYNFEGGFHLNDQFYRYDSFI